ncbi:MAG: VWA domain-containing protein [Gammaproteobacteria bacterium]|nr:VWA domain-containing protein [Gammaproteobacteria bacterium]
MELTLGRFVHALRAADVEVSPAETLDAFAVAEHVGLRDRSLLQNALRLTLAKTAEEKAAFDLCFPRFFEGLAIAEPLKRSVLRTADTAAFLDEVRALEHPVLSEAVEAALAANHTGLSRLLRMNVDEDALDDMRQLRDKTAVINAAVNALGLPALDGFRAGGGSLATTAAHVQQYLKSQIKAHVDQQYRLRVDASGQRALLNAALAANLQQLPPAYYAEVERVVRKLAERLARRHRRRRKKDRRGQLDVRRMLRTNIAYDGSPVNLHWRKQKRERATVFLVCDISNSVSQIARFLLLLMYQLQDVLPSVRSFAFSNRLGEITRFFGELEPLPAIESAIVKLGRGTTDYGHAMHDLHELIGKDISRRSTLIFLGDARSNGFPARADLFRGMSRQAGQVWWLTPETEDRWTVGDCVLSDYRAWCRGVLTCNRLQDIEWFTERLLEGTRSLS